MKVQKDFEHEFCRTNVTPGEFFAYLRKMQKKYPDEICNDFNLEYFMNPGDTFDSHYDFGTPGIRPCSAETVIVKPFCHHTHIRDFDGTCYTEIIEFDFWDESRGYGYYYTFQSSVAQEDRENNIREELESTIKSLKDNIEVIERAIVRVECASKYAIYDPDTKVSIMRAEIAALQASIRDAEEYLSATIENADKEVNETLGIPSSVSVSSVSVSSVSAQKASISCAGIMQEDSS